MADIDYRKLQKERKLKIKHYKEQHPELVIRCPKCKTALSYIHINTHADWKCPSCKEVTSYDKIKASKDKSVKGGKRRRVLTPDKIISHEHFATLLEQKMPNSIEMYDLPSKKALKLITKLAFCAMMYVSGNRVTEIVGQKHPENDKEFIVRPLTRNQIRIELNEDGSKSIIINNTSIVKTRPQETFDGTLKFKNYPTKKLQLVYDYDAKIFAFVEKYIEIMDKLNENRTYQLFKFTRQTGWRYVQEVFDKQFYCHWLRHSRFTNISEDMKFNELMITKFAGWTTTRMAKDYVHLTPELLYDAMKQRYKSQSH